MIANMFLTKFFRFACEGLKRLPSDQNEKIYQLIKVCLKMSTIREINSDIVGDQPQVPEE